MKKRYLSISTIFLITASSLMSQVVYEISDCIRTGLDRNFSLLISRNNESVARNNYTLGNAGYLPSLDMTGRYSGTVNDTRRNLSDGTETSSDGDHNTTTTVGLSMGLTVFNGFNVQTTYKKLGELKQVGELNTQLAVENLVAQIVSAYYNYIQQIELLNNLKYAVVLSKERLRIDEDRYLLGSSSKMQVLQSRVYLNADSSRLSRQYEVVRAAQVRLNELMAVEDMSQAFLTPDTAIIVNPGLLYESLFEQTLQNNTNLKIASSNLTISEYD
ncbi:MAG: TolC family protein, partial [Bacteroidales bacterium]|nr:TolC family protein [Bacteroidales bacterium]